MLFNLQWYKTQKKEQIQMLMLKIRYSIETELELQNIDVVALKHIIYICCILFSTLSEDILPSFPLR